MQNKLNIAFFGSSLVSSYWNGAATYYRGLLRALAERGHSITFFEPDAFERQAHRDMDDPPWAKVVVYAAEADAALKCLEQAAAADIIVKASGVGVFDALLEREVLSLRGRHGNLVIFWDVDAPATLERLQADPEDAFHELVPQYDAVLTYGGGPRVVREYELLGARQCTPVYNAVDPRDHYPVAADTRFAGTLGFLGNRMPDREARVHEFFFRPASQMPAQQFVLGGSGWNQNLPDLPNVSYIGHVYSRDHNAFNCTPTAVLNINRTSMASYGYSPATRIFEAAGAGACTISDRWLGIEEFLEPGREILLAENGDEVQHHLAGLDDAHARAIGDAARRRVLSEHTYRHRAEQVEQVLEGIGTTESARRGMAAGLEVTTE